MTENREVPAAFLPSLPPNVAAAVRTAARNWSDRTFANYPYLNECLTFQQLDEQSDRLTAWLVRHGVHPGDRVAVMLENVPQWPVSWAAILKAGASTVPINVKYRPADIAHVLRDSGATFVLTSVNNVAAVQAVVRHERLPCDVVDLPAKLAGLPSSDRVGDANPSRDDLASLQYTSGTTGFPKACMLTHSYWLELARDLAVRAHVTADDVMIVCQAWSYVDPQWITTMSLLTGARLSIEPRFSASGFWPAARAAGATITYVLGAMPSLLFKQTESEHDRDNTMRLVLCSGIPVDLHAQLEQRWGAPWREIYGSTETGVDLMSAPEDTEVVGTGALGLPPQGKRVRLLDENGQDVGVGERGEIVVEGSPLMLGYWNHPDATAAVLHKQRYRTGDLGVMDERGRIRHAGRLKDIIRRGGENISAAEVESVVARHEAVLSAAVAGVPDEIYDEIPKAFIVLREGTVGSPELAAEIFGYVESQLAPFKVPDLLEFCDSFPMTPSERVEKRKLVAMKINHRAGAYARRKGA